MPEIRKVNIGRQVRATRSDELYACECALYPDEWGKKVTCQYEYRENQEKCLFALDHGLLKYYSERQT